MRVGPFLKIESPIDRIVATQVTATVFAAVVSLIFGLVAAYSTLLGGLVCVIPGYVAARMLVRQEPWPVDTGLRPVIRSELVKWALSGVLFIASFTLVKTLDLLFFFGAFIGLQLVYLAVPAIDATLLRRAAAGKKALDRS